VSLPDLTSRATDPELLDEGVAEEEALGSLRDLRFVNRWLGNPGSVLRAVRPVLPEGGRLLDVGSASGDLPTYLLARLPRGARAVGLDIKPLHFRFAPASISRVVADVRQLPFRDLSFDVVIASLFLHHFGPAELPQILSGLFGLTRRALVVSDLERALVPYLFGRLAFPLLFRSRVSVVDGLVSIRRGFRRQELESAFRTAGLTQVRVTRHFPYRLLAVAERSPVGTPPRDG
jgi:SAM-dependent methyltransferase